MIVTDGQVSNATLSDYMIPSFEDMPPRLSIRLLESKQEGARVYGLGESALPAVAPAIGNAVFDACKVRVTTLPLTPEKVLRGIRSAEESR